MGVEVATWVSDLVPSNPGSSDLRSQGDDHIRLIKTVLQDSFPTAGKAWYNPTSQAKSADFTVVATDMNKTFLVTTTGGLVNATLPTLAAGDAGWECFVMKVTTDVNPILIKPPTGTLTSGAISGLAAARRSVPTHRIQCLWTGTSWIVSRAIHVPVGSCIEYHGSTLPFGYEWPNGQASVATNYPEYNAVIGSGATLDKRGRIGVTLDNLGGSSAGRLSGGIITGTAIGNVGGADTIALTAAQIPSITSTTSSVNVSVAPQAGTSVPQAPGGISNNNGTLTAGSNTFVTCNSASWIGTTSLSGTAAAGTATSNNTSGTAHPNLQPSIMVAALLVVE